MQQICEVSMEMIKQQNRINTMISKVITWGLEFEFKSKIKLPINREKTSKT
jgi:hypothetical protein